MWRTTARTADISRCASTDWTGLIRRFSSTRVPSSGALAGVYGLEQIPANMIERVEVMRGGGSALFGSSAIAGTINIITKEPVRNSAQFSHTLTGIGDASVSKTIPQ